MGVFSRMRNWFTGKPDKNVSRIQMVTEYGEHYYAWNGKLYESDIIRACIRPKTQAIGKIVGKHIRETIDKNGEMKFSVNPDRDIRKILEQPNSFMTGQMFQEKMANQLALSGNAFALIVRDDQDVLKELYPIPTSGAEACYLKDGTLCVKFTYLNGKSNTFLYTDLIHLRRDYYGNDVFGASQASALFGIMDIVGMIDQGIVNAIKNSGVIRWLLMAKSSMRQEDLKNNVKNFVDNYMSYESDTFGAAGIDAKFDAKQIDPKDYVPNASLTKQQTERIYSFFNTNEKIVTSSFSEEQWNSYYDAEIEPVVAQFSNEYTTKLFTARERACGNRIVFEASNLQCASINTKLALQAMVDRGAMTPNEWRQTLNLAPIPGGDDPIRRLDTQVVGMIETLITGVNDKNYKEICRTIRSLISASAREVKDNAEIGCKGNNCSE